jgi:high-affinity K+ transport system ATPase subunit B
VKQLRRRKFPGEVDAKIDEISKQGGTPLVVARGHGQNPTKARRSTA